MFTQSLDGKFGSCVNRNLISYDIFQKSFRSRHFFDYSIVSKIRTKRGNCS